ncbi:MAG: hypothetical protein RQ826_11740, partial [Xanthomonadales bacterium]|nr:hypothetical protein [Xanthomonadales bacterium]
MRTTRFSFTARLSVLLLGLLVLQPAAAQEALFEFVGVPETTSLPEHVSAAQPVRINQRAFRSPTIEIDLFGNTVRAVRSRVAQLRAGEFVWIGHLEGSSGDRVVLSRRARQFSGLIQSDGALYR